MTANLALRISSAEMECSLYMGVLVRWWENNSRLKLFFYDCRVGWQ